MNSKNSSLQQPTLVQLTKDLTQHEEKEYRETLKTVDADPETQRLSLQYFIQFKKQMGYISPQKLTIAVKCAYFMAEKSQSVCTVGVFVLQTQGQKISGYSLSLNQFLQTHNLDDILITLREFTKRVKVNDIKAELQLNSVVQQISFLIKMHSKFEDIVRILNIKQIGNAGGDEYLKSFKSITWLLFISTRKDILKKSLQIIQNTCLLAHAICSMIITAWDYARTIPIVNESGLNEDSSWKDISKTVRQKVLQKFHIKSMDLYKHIAHSFQEQFKKMMTTAILKGHIVNKGDNQIVDFLAPQIISSNCQRLDTVYRKSLNYNDLDERIFDKDRVRSLTPTKITPFAKQGYINRLSKIQQKTQGQHGTANSFASHRILTYESPSQLQQLTVLRSGCSYQKITIPKSVRQTPSTIKQPLIQTPISSGMEMFNYLLDKTKNKRTKGLRVDMVIDQLLNKVFQRDERESDPYTRKVKKEMIFGFHSIVMDQYGLQTQNTHRNNLDSISFDKLNRAVLGVSAQLVFFVSNINVSFGTIEEVLELDVLQQWRVCNFLLNFDRNMPTILKLHLLDIQVNLVSHKIWQSAQLVSELQNCAQLQQGNNLCILRLLKRVLHQTAHQLVQLTTLLKLQQDLTQQIFQTIKLIILNYTFLLEGQHLDQLILCSVFVNCKIKAKNSDKYKISFSEIIQKYQDANPNNKKLHNRIIQKIQVGLGKKTLTIIQYYNTIYIPNTRDLFRRRGQGEKENFNHIKRRNSVLQSPLRNIIPKELLLLQRRCMNGQNKQQITPQTSLLMAYNESPMLKCDYNSFKVPLNSKKVIDFQVEQEKLLKNTSYEEQEEERVSQSQTSDFFAKRFKQKGNAGSTSSSQMIHIMPITSPNTVSATVVKTSNSVKTFGSIANRC